ncbi:hypothetical protein [Calothrix sp. PCC 7507]|uniref:hypothetical protein n=1 Tax=Calothrix sp. PCC 7507 TaxID=99598 RepID=UPI0002F7E6D2|nr:hypothetical protein [Calothrix sp. PCC 7507]
MKIDINNALTIILGLLTLTGAIYRLSQIEANINAKISKSENHLLTAIDNLKDTLTDKLYTTEKKLDVHLTEYSEKKIFAEYRFNSIDKAIEHKFNRLANWIKQIGAHLYRQSGFEIHDDQF